MSATQQQWLKHFNLPPIQWLLMQMRDAARCNQDPMLGEMFTLVRSQALLEQRLESIAHKLSDAGLQQMPDFNQRIAVLRRMGYIANDNTVQIKVIPQALVRSPVTQHADPMQQGVCQNLSRAALLRYS